MSSPEFHLSELSPFIGAVVEGLRLEDDREVASTVRALLLKHKAVMFRDQGHLDHHAYYRLASCLGTPETHPFGSEEDPLVTGISPFQPFAEYPEITGIYHDREHPGNLNAWHSDLNWRAVPTFASLLRAVVVPSLGGDTCFASMAAAYQLLEAEQQAELADLRVVHDWYQIYAPAFATNPALLEQMRDRYPPQSHPLVLEHPFTKERCLFSNKVSGTRIEGLDQSESDRILSLVHSTAHRPEVQCRFTWREGDVALWDNLAVQHYAVSDYWPHPRRMERITLEGVPF